MFPPTSSVQNLTLMSKIDLKIWMNIELTLSLRDPFDILIIINCALNTRDNNSKLKIF